MTRMRLLTGTTLLAAAAFLFLGSADPATGLAARSGSETAADNRTPAAAAYDDHHPNWSPDGSRLIFDTTRHGN